MSEVMVDTCSHQLALGESLSITIFDHNTEWVFGSSAAIATCALAAGLLEDPKSRQEKAQYSRVLPLQSINVHSIPEAGCFSFRNPSNQCHNVHCSFGSSWKIQSCSPHFTALHRLALVCFTGFAFLSACFCHSANSGFAPSPYFTSLLFLDTSVVGNFYHLRRKKTTFLHFIDLPHTYIISKLRRISFVSLPNTMFISSIYLSVLSSYY